MASITRRRRGPRSKPIKMMIQEHKQTALDFLTVSDSEFAAGDMMQASEKLWGAASHAVMAYCQQRDWPYGNHRSLKVAARQLTEETGETIFREGFGAAEKFHANYYHAFLEDFQIEADRPVVHEFVHRLLDYVA